MIYKAVHQYAENNDLKRILDTSKIIRKEQLFTNVSQQYKNSQRTMIYKQCFAAVQEYAKNNLRTCHSSTRIIKEQWFHSSSRIRKEP